MIKKLSDYKLDKSFFIRQLTDAASAKINLPNDIAIILKKGVFMPSQETLNLIDIAIKTVYENKNIRTIADLGTGTGIIAITLAKLFPDTVVIATDISFQALKLADYNARQNLIHTIAFLQTNNDKWIPETLPKKIDFVVSNPPYIGDLEYFDSEFQKKYPEIKYDPELAVRSFDRSGITPHLNILRESKDMGIKFYLFQCNTKSINELVQQVNINEFTVDTIKDECQKDRFLYLERK